MLWLVFVFFLIYLIESKQKPLPIHIFLNLFLSNIDLQNNAISHKM